jgi:hypothetical protein
MSAPMADIGASVLTVDRHATRRAEAASIEYFNV